jgi:hypothetical protein
MARGNLPPVRDEIDPTVINLKKAKIVCDSELSGHLKSYRAAARAVAADTAVIACARCCDDF